MMNTDCLCRKKAFAKGADIPLGEALTTRAKGQVSRKCRKFNRSSEKGNTACLPGVKEKGSTEDSIRTSDGT